MHPDKSIENGKGVLRPVPILAAVILPAAPHTVIFQVLPVVPQQQDLLALVVVFSEVEVLAEIILTQIPMIAVAVIAVVTAEEIVAAVVGAAVVVVEEAINISVEGSISTDFRFIGRFRRKYTNL